MGDTALTIVTGIVIAVVSTYLTFYLSLTKFRTERWWERKADAYLKIIDALHRSKALTENYLEAQEEGRVVSKEEDKKLTEDSKKAHKEINMAIEIGALLLSNEALKKLKQFQKRNIDLGRADLYKYLENDLATTKSCFNELIEIAKKDLQIK